jgi:cysteine dioxygenase
MIYSQLNWLNISKTVHALGKYPTLSDLPEDLQYLFKNIWSLKIEAQNANEAYGRNVLYSTPEYEVMLASWRPNMECAPHDHGFSSGTVLVLEGAFEEVSYTPMDNGELAINPKTARRLQKGQFIEVEGDVFHSMKNIGNIGLTLHFYKPSIQNMQVLDLKNKQTLMVTGDCGAWIPSDAQKIIGVQKWSQTKIG